MFSKIKIKSIFCDIQPTGPMHRVTCGEWVRVNGLG